MPRGPRLDAPGVLHHVMARVVHSSEFTEGSVLSAQHPIGRFKARFFRAMGYSDDNWLRLAEDLRNTHALSEVDATIPTGYGTKYEVRALLTGPNGISVYVTSVWIVLRGEEAPRFVTAYPGG